MRIWVWRHASFGAIEDGHDADHFEDALEAPDHGFLSSSRARIDAEAYLTGNAIANGCPVPETAWRGSDEEGSWRWDFNDENDTILVSAVEVRE